MLALLSRLREIKPELFKRWKHPKQGFPALQQLGGRTVDAESEKGDKGGSTEVHFA